MIPEGNGGQLIRRVKDPAGGEGVRGAGLGQTFSWEMNWERKQQEKKFTSTQTTLKNSFQDEEQKKNIAVTVQAPRKSPILNQPPGASCINGAYT